MKNIGRFLFIAVMSLLPASGAAIASTADGAKSFFSSAEGKFGNGDYQGAITDDNKAIELDPSFVPAYINRASEKLDMGDKPGAIADLLAAARRGHAGAQQWLSNNGVSGW
jgi:hypothetical protein